MVPENPLALVCSSGGHLFELLSLKSLWADRPHFWVSFDTQDARSLLAGEDVVWAFHPTNRNLFNWWRNWRLARRVLAERKPGSMLSTGAGVAVPFLLVGKRLGAHTVYVESITRIQELSLSGRLLYGRVDEFLVQWEELAARFPKASYQGRIL